MTQIYTEEEIEDLLKKPTEENHVLIQLHYDNYLVLPYDAGVEVMRAFKQAEIQYGYNESEKGIKGLTTEGNFSVISHQQYIEYKMRHLMKKVGDT